MKIFLLSLFLVAPLCAQNEIGTRISSAQVLDVNGKVLGEARGGGSDVLLQLSGRTVNITVYPAGIAMGQTVLFFKSTDCSGQAYKAGQPVHVLIETPIIAGSRATLYLSNFRLLINNGGGPRKP